ncbi:MAG TPA: hypothetical protein VFJ19_04305 [Nocardioidaceae bacterium]|nr:hypothetical protein [Nocardioidaceae bacterium]
MSPLFKPVAPRAVVDAAGLPRSERPLAAAQAEDGTWLLGTRDALVLVVSGQDSMRIPWERLESAEWERDEERLQIIEVADFGRPRPVRTYVLRDPGQMLALVRERVTASVVLQRRVVVARRKGLTVIARRPPAGGAITWAYRFDPGVEPDDPEVRRIAEEGLRAAAEELGEAGDPI